MILALSNNQFEDIISALEHRADLIDLLQDKKRDFEKSITNTKRTATKKASQSTKTLQLKKLKML